MRSPLVSLACLFVAAAFAVTYIAAPRVETRTITTTVTKTIVTPTPSRPTLAQIKQLLGPLVTIQRKDATVDGRPGECFWTDSTFSPTRRGATWAVTWCWASRPGPKS